MGRVVVDVMPKPEILDPQGKAVSDALQTLGFAGVRDVRVGRHVIVETDADTPDAADRLARSMCERLLANPVTEDYEIATVSEA